MKKLMTIIMLMTAMVMTGGAATYDFSQNGLVEHGQLVGRKTANGSG